MRTNQRGSALLTAVIAVLVVSVIAAAMIRFAGRESVGASAGVHERALAACAEAARLQLISQARAVGFTPTNLQPLSVRLGTSGSGGQTLALGGHYDTTATNVVIDQVTPLPGSTGGPNRTARDITNVSAKGASSASFWKVVVHCQDGDRQLEVEFGFQFGL